MRTTPSRLTGQGSSQAVASMSFVFTSERILCVQYLSCLVFDREINFRLNVNDNKFEVLKFPESLPP